MVEAVHPWSTASVNKAGVGGVVAVLTKEGLIMLQIFKPLLAPLLSLQWDTVAVLKDAAKIFIRSTFAGVIVTLVLILAHVVACQCTVWKDDKKATNERMVKLQAVNDKIVDFGSVEHNACKQHVGKIKTFLLL